MAEDMGERTEQATPRRMNQARQRGQVAKSQDLSAAIALAAAIIILVIAGGYLGRSFATIMRETFDTNGAGWTGDTASVWPLVREASLRGGRVLLPVLLATFAFAYFAQYIQVGWMLTLKPIQPKLNKLNPISGAKRLFSKRNAVKSVVNSAKLAVAFTVAVLVISTQIERIIGLPALSAVQGMLAIGRMVLLLALWLAAVLLVLALIDWIYQKWQHKEDLKMTKQEVKDERRSMDGDPQVRGRRLRMMRDIAMQQVQQQVPSADVVVTNPTHFAVALRYDSETMTAPRVVAKGADFMAQRIRLVAAASGVPIVERPPLARGLYFGVEVGREIAPEYYSAVAEILAYVYRLETDAQAGTPAGRWADRQGPVGRRQRIAAGE